MAKIPLKIDGAHSFEASDAQGVHSRLKPSTEARKTKIMTLNPTMNTARYMYSVMRKEFAPERTTATHIQMMSELKTHMWKKSNLLVYQH